MLFNRIVTMPTYPTYKLGEICELLNGFAFKSSNYVQSGLRVIRITNVKKGYVIDDEPQFYPIETQEELKKYILKKGDLLISLTGNVGRVGILSEELLPAALNQRVGCLRVKDKNRVSLQYLFHLLNTNSFEKDCINSSKGIAQKNMSTEWLKEYEINLPPLATQRAIVTRIETLFAELDKAVQHLRTAQQQLKTYRQAVLKAAFEGCENAEKHLFGELMADVRNGYGAKPTDCGTNKLLRISSVRAMNLNLDDFRFNNSSFDERNIIQENDLLFTRYNGSVDLVGVCAYVPELYDTYAYPDKIIRFRPKVCNTFHSKFLQYYINQGKAREFVRSKIKTTSGQNGISGSDIKKIEIPLPTLTEQQRIVKEIESRLSQATASETYIENALQQAEALRQSILKKAFSGELV